MAGEREQGGAGASAEATRQEVSTEAVVEVRGVVVVVVVVVVVIVVVSVVVGVGGVVIGFSGCCNGSGTPFGNCGL